MQLASHSLETFLL